MSFHFSHWSPLTGHHESPCTILANGISQGMISWYSKWLAGTASFSHLRVIYEGVVSSTSYPSPYCIAHWSWKVSISYLVSGKGRVKRNGYSIHINNVLKGNFCSLHTHNTHCKNNNNKKEGTGSTNCRWIKISHVSIITWVINDTPLQHWNLVQVVMGPGARISSVYQIPAGRCVYVCVRVHFP